MDRVWGHLTIKMSGHPPFGAQVILNGHEYVARQAQVAAIGFSLEGNCFTAVADPQALARVADTRILERFPEIVTRLRDIAERFCTALDCIDIGFLPDDTLEDLPLPSRIGASRISGVDLHKARIRRVLAAALALSAAPNGFTVADLTARVHAIAADTDYTHHPARPHTTCASCAERTWSTNPAGHTATECRPSRPASSPPW